MLKKIRDSMRRETDLIIYIKKKLITFLVPKAKYCTVLTVGGPENFIPAK